jgi:hypothetical protein
MMTFAEAVAEIQKMIDEGRPYEEICAVIARHADEGTILIGDVELRIGGEAVPSFEIELGGDR